MIQESGAPAPGPAGSPGAITLIGVVNALLRQRAIVIGLPLLAFVTTITVWLLQPKEFVAASQILPDTRSPGSVATGVAARFGISLGGSTPRGDSPEFYAMMVQSRGLLRQVASRPYEIHDARSGTRTVTLADVYEVEEGTEEQRLRAAVRELALDVTAAPNPVTGVVRIEATGPAPELAVAINHAVIEALVDFNVEKRQSQAKAEREFLEQRVQDASAALNAAESALQRFLQQNRTYATSPQLSFEAARLERELAQRQQTYATLTHALEQARIEEVRNTPTLSIVERPEDTVRRTRRPIGVILAIVLMGSIFAGMLIGLVRDYFQRAPAPDPADAAEFSRLKAEIRSNFRRSARVSAGSEHQGSS